MIKEYNKNGYYLAKNLFPKIEIEAMNEEIRKIFCFFTKNGTDEEIISFFKEDFDAYYGCAILCQNLLSLLKLFTTKSLINLLNKLNLEYPTMNTKPLISFSSKELAKNEFYWKIPAHQDWHSTQGSINGVTCWIPLVNINNELGPLEVVPESHLLGSLDYEDKGVPTLIKQDWQWQPLPMEIGDALILSNFLIHRSGINKTNNKIRLTTHFRYNDAKESTFIKRKFPYHLIDKRKEGIIFTPTIEEINSIFPNC